MQRTTCRILGTILIVVALSQSAWSQASQKWVVSWAASAQGPYPVGNVSAQPDQRFAFPDPATGAKDQTMRLIMRPSIWGQHMRIRLSNVFGTKLVTFDVFLFILRRPPRSTLFPYTPSIRTVDCAR